MGLCSSFELKSGNLNQKISSLVLEKIQNNPSNDLK